MRTPLLLLAVLLPWNAALADCPPASAYCEDLVMPPPRVYWDDDASQYIAVVLDPATFLSGTMPPACVTTAGPWIPTYGNAPTTGPNMPMDDRLFTMLTYARAAPGSTVRMSVSHSPGAPGTVNCRITEVEVIPPAVTGP
ncbi:MAG: hypothetical protein H6733_00020 [Alphaproteobacteria bacterium]|nr:hypothetical protein [Alphaproteobacteria bacterium]